MAYIKCLLASADCGPNSQCCPNPWGTNWLNCPRKIICSCFW